MRSMGDVFLGLIFNNSGLITTGDEFLADVRRIAHDGIQFRQLDHLALPLT